MTKVEILYMHPTKIYSRDRRNFKRRFKIIDHVRLETYFGQ